MSTQVRSRIASKRFECEQALSRVDKQVMQATTHRDFVFAMSEYNELKLQLELFERVSKIPIDDAHRKDIEDACRVPSLHNDGQFYVHPFVKEIESLLDNKIGETQYVQRHMCLKCNEATVLAESEGCLICVGCGSVSNWSETGAYVRTNIKSHHKTAHPAFPYNVYQMLATEFQRTQSASEQPITVGQISNLARNASGHAAEHLAPVIRLRGSRSHLAAQLNHREQ